MFVPTGKSTPESFRGAAAVLTRSEQIAKQWDPKITWGKCLPAVNFYTGMASLTICFDVAMLVPVAHIAHISFR
jgi:hypothetical protein